MPTFAIPGPVTATVEVAGAQVRVTASDRTDTMVLVEPRNPTSRKDVKVAGKTKVDLADGQLTVKTITPGQAWIGHAAADLELSSSSGGFDIDRADGNVTATTASGAIRIGRMTHGQAKLMSGSGNIEVGISDGTAASIDVTSERGAVHNSVASPESTGAPDATVMVHARTRPGDIIIQRAAS